MGKNNSKEGNILETDRNFHEPIITNSSHFRSYKQGYESPEEEYNPKKDDEKNRYLLGKLLYKNPNQFMGLGKNLDNICKCCGNLSKKFYQCFNCVHPKPFYYSPLCEKCYENPNNRHFHKKVNFFVFIDSPNVNVSEIEKKKTSVEKMLESFKRYKNRFFVGYRERIDQDFEWISYNSIFENVIFLSKFLTRKLELKKSDFIGIFAKNCPEWMIVDFSCLYCGFVNVPVPQTFDFNAKKLIIEQTKIKCIFCSKLFLDECIDLKRETKNLIKYIIVINEKNEIVKETEQPTQNFWTIIEEGKKYKEDLHPSKQDKDDIISIVFRSSNDIPRGIIFREKHWNLSNPTTIYPLIEVMCLDPSSLGGRRIIQSTFYNGGRFAILTESKICNLFEDYKTINPNVISCPPIVLKKVYNEFITKKGGKEKAFIDMKNQRIFGDRVVMFSTGGAPITPKTKRFISMLTDTPVYEGYSITEVGVIVDYDNRIRKNYKLHSVPELGLTVNDKPFPRGELLIKKDCNFREYINQNNCNEYFSTGDIVEVRGSNLIVIGRKKNIFKLKGGFVSLEKIESIFSTSQLIKQIVCFPCSNMSKLFGIVVVNELNSKKEDISKEIRVIAKESELKLCEVPENILIITEEFSIENKLLTVSYKINRTAVIKKYKKKIKELFSGF